MSSNPTIWPLGYGFDLYDFFAGLDEVERLGVSLEAVQRLVEADRELATYHLCLLASNYPENARAALKALLDMVGEHGGGA